MILPGSKPWEADVWPYGIMFQVAPSQGYLKICPLIDKQLFLQPNTS